MENQVPSTNGRDPIRDMWYRIGVAVIEEATAAEKPFLTPKIQVQKIGTSQGHKQVRVLRRHSVRLREVKSNPSPNTYRHKSGCRFPQVYERQNSQNPHHHPLRGLYHEQDKKERGKSMKDAHKKALVQQFAEVLRMARRSNVEDLELSDDGNTVTIHFEGGGRRPVNVEMDSDTALLLDVIRKVLY